jgi:nucleoside-diphosphate-sugar epimerase
MGSIGESIPKRILITGAAGFIGQALAAALIQDPYIEKLILTDVTKPSTPKHSLQADPAVICESEAGDLTDKATCEGLCSRELTHVYLLHGIMSGAAEANLELGLRVNLDSMRLVLDELRKRPSRKPIRVIFPSSLAVYGPTSDSELITESTIPLPQSSYGAQKAMMETLLNDYSRRGLMDARIVRLPTIIVRPGAPSGAASSFCSAILREPLNGAKAVLPVPKALKLWVCSARTVVKNLVALADIDENKFAGRSRVVNLPGITVSVQDMLSALFEVGGEGAYHLVESVRDEKVETIVGSWPARFEISRSKELGLSEDVSLVQTVRDYITDYK